MPKYFMSGVSKYAAIDHQREAARAHDEACLLLAFGYPKVLVVYLQRKAAFHAEIARLFMLGSEH